MAARVVAGGLMLGALAAMAAVLRGVPEAAARFRDGAEP